MARFSNCIYAKYFAEYSMRLCKHPANKDYSEAPCKGCLLHETNHDNIDKCPFCESHKTVLLNEYPNNWYVHCCNCRASGPVKKDAREAKEAWNKRK